MDLVFPYRSRVVILLTRRPSELALHLNVLSQCSRDKRFNILSIISLKDSDLSSVTALMLAVGVNSLVSGAFQYRPFFKLQLVPHLTKHHQVCALDLSLLLTMLIVSILLSCVLIAQVVATFNISTGILKF
jgi:hypothetical protein